MYWNEFKKYIFAYKFLKDLAKLFIASKRGITTWINEYKSTNNSAQLCKMLMRVFTDIFGKLRKWLRAVIWKEVL